MPENKAAFLNAAQQPLDVKEAPYADPNPNEIILRNHAVAVNPVDYATQLLGTNLFPWLVFPAIGGYDVAGEVVAIGPDVTHFKVGDRVVGLTTKAFQTFVPVLTHVAAPIPASISYEQASVIPLALATASVGLFGKEYLALEFPSVDVKPTGKAVLIWGGATSVGSCAIQAAASAGYEVITTTSPKNFEYAKKLGASHVFDYRSESVKDDIIAAFSGKESAGIYAISGADAESRASVSDACLEIISKISGKKFIAFAAPPPESIPEGIGAKFVMSLDPLQDVALGSAIYTEYLSKALDSGAFKPAPDAEVTGKGLGAIQGAMDALQKGVSAKKLVVSV